MVEPIDPLRIVVVALGLTIVALAAIAAFGGDISGLSGNVGDIFTPLIVIAVFIGFVIGAARVAQGAG